MKTTFDPIIVAADGGGTGCRACAGTLSRGIIAQASGGPGNVHSNFEGAIANLKGAIEQALQRAGLHVPENEVTAHLGVAGAHSEVEMERVRAVLPYGRSSVTGDRATNVRGVLGEADGYVVALGTGTIVARQEALQMRTIGGWGFDLSDQASGAWLGQRVMEETVLCEDGLRSHTALSNHVLTAKGGLIPMIEFSTTAVPGAYALLARDVVAAAKDGDAIAVELMQEGAAYIMRGLRVLGFEAGDLLALAGGLGPHYAPYLDADFTKNLASPKGTALDGAFAIASLQARAAQ